MLASMPVIADAHDLVGGEVLIADVCIAGAGAAGITIARDLVGSGLRVIMLESGGLERDEETQALYQGPHTGLPLQPLDFCRLRYFGGSTNHWSGICRRIEPEVFADRPGVAEGWPIDPNVLAPYYRLAHATCGIGANEFEAAPIAERAGASLWPLDPTRVDQVVYQLSAPVRFGEAYRQELSDADNVTIYLHGNVTQVTLTEAGGRVQAFACATLRGTRFEVQADHYVLALGGIENPRVLLASTEQERAGVGNAHDLVGRYFMEHPHVYAGAAIIAHRAVDASFYLHGAAVDVVDGDDQAPVPTRVIPAIAPSAVVRARESLIALACTIGASNPRALSELTDTFRPDQIGSLLRAGTEDLAVFMLTVRTEQRPLRESRVTLTAERDALGMPRARVDWRVADEDRADLRRGFEILGAEIARARVGRLWMAVDGNGRYPTDGITGGCHHMGTTRMSDDPERGVVDAHCRVHGLENLFVAGSSVFPSAGFANPTLTIVALAHRLAAHLRQRVKGKG